MIGTNFNGWNYRSCERQDKGKRIGRCLWCSWNYRSKAWWKNYSTGYGHRKRGEKLEGEERIEVDMSKRLEGVEQRNKRKELESESRELKASLSTRVK